MSNPITYIYGRYCRWRCERWARERGVHKLTVRGDNLESNPCWRASVESPFIPRMGITTVVADSGDHPTFPPHGYDSLASGIYAMLRAIGDAK